MFNLLHSITQWWRLIRSTRSKRRDHAGLPTAHHNPSIILLTVRHVKSQVCGIVFSEKWELSFHYATSLIYDFVNYSVTAIQL